MAGLWPGYRVLHEHTRRLAVHFILCYRVMVYGFNNYIPALHACQVDSRTVLLKIDH